MNSPYPLPLASAHHRSGTEPLPSDGRSFIWSTVICGLVTGAFATFSPPVQHWFVFPVLACGILIGSDAVDWFRGRISLLDPVGIIGVLGLHFFFLAPLLHVHWDSWMRGVIPPPDWRPWLGAMALLNLTGLLAYRLGRRITWRKSAEKLPLWRASGRLPWALAVALLVSLFLQIDIYRSLGGIAGYMLAARLGLEEIGDAGRTFMISESFPLIAMIAFVLWAGRRRIPPSLGMLVLVLILFAVVQMLFGGLRGSRSNTVWTCFWAVGLIHVWVRSVPRWLIYSGAGVMIAFLYVYGFYKSLGTDALGVFESGGTIALEEQSGRSAELLLLGDLGRADVQALLLERITGDRSEYEFAWGGTYLGALSLFIPSSLYPDRPPLKTVWGARAQYGRSVFVDGDYSSRVYGLAGETMLNFGPALIPLAFAIWGGIVGWIRRLQYRLEPGDLRWLTLPLLVNVAFIMVAADLDGLIVFTFKHGFVPGLVLLFGMRWVIRRVPEPHLALSSGR